MKLSNHFILLAGLSAMALMTGAPCLLTPSLQAAGQPAATSKTAVSQQWFATPEDAVTALRSAAEDKDKAALDRVFGPEVHDLLTGDEVQDANNARNFAAHLAQGCAQVREGDDKITLEIGTNNWPMPVPLVKVNGQWHFDTAAGKEEVINRHIGKDELHAISVCRAFVVAQRQFAAANPGTDGKPVYALKFKSSPGLKDGLYWPATGSEPDSPFGPLVAEAHAEGYFGKQTPGPKPFHGYLFRILTRQGKQAPGGKLDYMSRGKLTDGFALVAYPEIWDKSGVMTFIINQDGKLYQRNLGEDTARRASAMKEYNPGPEWTLAPDDGVPGAVSEK